MYCLICGLIYAGSVLFGTFAAVAHQAQEADAHQHDGGGLGNGRNYARVTF